MFRTKSNNPQLSLFDIRLQTPYKNILVIKGSEYEAPSVLLSGHVVFSLPEAAKVRSVSLELTGTFKLDFYESVTEGKKVIANVPVKAEATVFRCLWDNLLVNEQGSIRTGDYGQPVIISDNALVRQVTSALNELLIKQEEAPAARPGTKPGAKPARPRSGLRRSNAPTTLELPPSTLTGCTPFEGVETPGGVSFQLPADNYSLPFSCVLPGNIPETIEGLQSGSMLYKLDAVIDRGKQQQRKSKYIRIFRTPAQGDAVLTEECSIENTWSGKVQYQVRLPKKAIPIGGVAKIDILIIPLCKGLRLGRIKCSVQQYCEMKGANGQVYRYDTTIYKSVFPDVPQESLADDRWLLEGSIHLPNNLKQCSQDCRLKDDIIVIKHRLIITVKIMNPDGHHSEVRSKLPITLYVSAKTPIEGRCAVVDNNGVIHFHPGTQPLFEPVGAGTHDVTPAEPSDLAAEIHAAVPSESPGPADADDEPVLPSYNASAKDPLYSPGEESGYVSPYFGSTVPTSGFNSPAMQYLSRVNSASNMASSAPTAPLSSSNMSVLPSYDSALDEDVPSIDLAPPYQGGGEEPERPRPESASSSSPRPIFGRSSSRPLLARAFSAGSLSNRSSSTIGARLSKKP